MIKSMPDKIASVMSYCVSGTLVCGGGVSQWIHDLDWNQVAVISGVVIGIATFLVNVYYKNRQTKAYEAALNRGYQTTPPQED
ncbi:class II holin family protein [Rahnella sp. BCC 1045]|uniref:phage holin n=1 Tax=Rahnella sp. BCC 1045 TaxID=2816251 RepID=UPI001C278206|nr:phage holin [Rahnella sp. BCC 1045]MBU9819939.1 class II holin family protein [Rahnella sp. BCC 1045]